MKPLLPPVGELLRSALNSSFLICTVIAGFLQLLSGHKILAFFYARSLGLPHHQTIFTIFTTLDIFPWRSTAILSWPLWTLSLHFTDIPSWDNLHRRWSTVASLWKHWSHLRLNGQSAFAVALLASFSMATSASQLEVCLFRRALGPRLSNGSTGRLAVWVLCPRLFLSNRWSCRLKQLSFTRISSPAPAELEARSLTVWHLSTKDQEHMLGGSTPSNNITEKTPNNTQVTNKLWEHTFWWLSNQVYPSAFKCSLHEFLSIFSPPSKM